MMSVIVLGKSLLPLAFSHSAIVVSLTPTAGTPPHVSASRLHVHDVLILIKERGTSHVVFYVAGYSRAGLSPLCQDSP